MSLLNTMINNLEARQGSLGSENPLPSSISAVKEDKGNIKPYFWIAASLALALYFLTDFDRSSTSVVVENTVNKNENTASNIGSADISALNSAFSYLHSESSFNFTLAYLIESFAAPLIDGAVEVWQASKQTTKPITFSENKDYSSKEVRPDVEIPSKESELEVNNVAKMSEQNSQEGELSSLPSTAAGKKTLEPTRKLNANVTTRLDIVRSSESKDSAVAAKAENLVKKGQYTQAEILLRNRISEHSNSPVSLRVLSDCYYSQSARAKLYELASTTHFHNQAVRNYVLAKLYVMDGKTSLAIDILENTTELAPIEVAYQTLLAGLYQKNQQYDKAEALYSRLLRIDSENISLWLGYAVASDKMNKYSQALNAYKTVHHIGLSNEKVKRYVENRIKDISLNAMNKG